jgi:hypothetical protein
MAYFVRNASKIAFKRIKKVFLIERFAKICLSKNISHNIKLFIPRHGLYIFEMCDIDLQKRKRRKVGKLSPKTF